MELEALIRSYPCQLRLRITLLDHVYSLLQDALPDDPRAIEMHATRRLRDLSVPKEDGKDIAEDDPHFVDGEKLIDALQSANERLTIAVKASAHPKVSEIYADFVSEWCRSPTLEPNLVRQIFGLVFMSLYMIMTTSQKQYLIGSLQALAQLSGALPVLQATHVRLLLRDNTSSKKRTLKFARKYSAASDSPSVWLARLDTEYACDQGDIKSAWASARTAVVASQDVDGTTKIWLWALDHQSSIADDQKAVYEVNYPCIHGSNH